MKLDSGLASQQQSAAKRILSPLPRRVRERPTLLLIGAGLLLLIWLGAHAIEVARAAAWNSRAPLVVDIRAFYCSLSPDGRFLTVSADNVQAGNDFFDAGTGALVSIPRPAGVDPAAFFPGLWLRDRVYLNYTRWRDEQGSATNYRTTLDDVPEDGWLVDVAARSTTMLAELDPAERASVLALARERLASADERSKADLRSPNGAYVFRDGAIYDQQGQQLVRTRMPGLARACSPGWKPDSSGIYFVDRERPPGSDVGQGAGDVRLLLVP